MTELTKFAAPLGRVLLALIFITSGWGKLWAIGGTMGYMQAMGVPGILIYPTILLELVGGIMLLVGYQ
ncbi:MAG: DoxX family protein, partial [Maritimibacter sp.]